MANIVFLGTLNFLQLLSPTGDTSVSVPHWTTGRTEQALENVHEKGVTPIECLCPER